MVEFSNITWKSIFLSNSRWKY